MKLEDLDRLAKGLAPVVADMIERATAPLSARLAEVEARAPLRGDKGEAGEPGRPGEKGADGAPGRDGATAEDLRPMVEEFIAAAFATVPQPKDGQPGAPGEPGLKGDKGDPGERGEKGADGISPSPEDLRPMILEMVAEAVAAIPKPADGKDGEPGPKGDPGERGEKGDAGDPGDTGPPGERGIDGKDGVGLAGALINREGSLILTMTDGRTCDLGFVVGKDGRDGSDGKDGERGPAGFSLDSFDTEMKDGGRTLVLKFLSGDTTEIHELGIDAMIYRGVFKQGSEYERGDVVTWGGSLWHCNQPTGAKPDDSRDGVPWSMAVRRGRDGKDGEKGQKGDPGRDAKGSA